MATLERLGMPTWAAGGWIPQSEKLARIKKIPGKVFASRPKLETSTEASVLATGVDYMADLSGAEPSSSRRMALVTAAETKAYCDQIGRRPDQWDAQGNDARGFVNNFLAPLGVFTDSLDEAYGDMVPYLIADNSQQRGFINAALAIKMANQTPKGIAIANYSNKVQNANYLFGKGIDSTAYRNTLVDQASARSGLGFYDLPVSSVARANFQWYPGAGLAMPIGRRWSYVTAYGLLRLKKASAANLEPLNFIWPSMESTIRPNPPFIPSFAWRLVLPTGELFRNDEGWASTNQLIEAVIQGHDFGGGSLMWERPEWVSEFILDANFVDRTDGLPLDVWKAINGAAQPKVRSGHRQYPNRPLSIYDAPFVGLLWAGEMNDRAGWGLQFLPHRVNRGSGWSDWREIDSNLPDATTLYIGTKMQGIARGKETGNDVCLHFTDPGCPITGEQVQVRLPSGRTPTFDVYGAETACLAGSLNPSQLTFPRNSANRLQ